MPIKPCPYFDPNEPSDDAEVRRYLTMFKFQKLMANEELYFARPNGFEDNDSAEGIPSRERVAALSGVSPHDLSHGSENDNIRGSFAQFRESYFISCWTLHGDETYRLWKEYAWDKKEGTHGVAIRTRYALLKAALEGLPDEINVGKVIYGKDKLARPGNAWCEITSKTEDFTWESEIRAMLYWPSVLSGGNLHIGADNRVYPKVLDENPRYHWNHDHKLRRIHLAPLLTGIVISPWAAQETIDEINLWVNLKKHTYSAENSPKSTLMPSFEDYLKNERLYR